VPALTCDYYQYERHVRGYKTGVYVKPAHFTGQNCKSLVKQYNDNFNGISDRRWELILSSLPKPDDEANETDDDGPQIISNLDTHRRNIRRSATPK
jgi:hypothetical protein